MATCLVTGGAGFLGSHLCDELLRRGHRVICVDNVETGSLNNIEHIRTPDFVLLHKDIIEPFFVEEPVDFVYHFASPASPIDYLRLPLHTLKVGSYGTHNALGLAKHHRARFLTASTSEVYGDPQVHPQPESYWGHVNPIGPRGVYDEAKRYAEALTMAYHRQQGVDTAIVRIFNTYGPRMRPHDGRAIPTFLRQALAGPADHRVRRRLPDALVLLRLRPHRRHHPPRRVRPPHAGQRRQSRTSSRCSSSRTPSSKSPGRGPEIVHEALPTDDPQVRQPDIALAREILGWEPQVELREGLRRTLEESGVETLTGAGLALEETRNSRETPALKRGSRNRGEHDHRDKTENVVQRPPRRPVAVPSDDGRRSRASARRRSRSCCARRRCATSLRIGTLLALDFGGLFAAIFTALMVKAVLRADTWAWHASYVEAKSLIAFAYLVTALLFARSGLYAERAQRPGLPKIVTSLFQTTVVALLFAVVSGEQYRATTSSTARWSSRSSTSAASAGASRGSRASLLRAAGYRRRALLVGSGQHIEDVAHALVDEVHAPVEMVGFISLTPRPDNGLRSLGRIEDLAKVLDSQRVAGGHHRRPGLPAEPGGRARRPVPPARGHGADRAVDDGDPRAPRGVRAGRLGAAVRAAPAGVRRLRLRGQAHVRLRRRARPDPRCSARCCC